MIDPNSETIVRLTQAGHLVNPHRPPSLASLWRWCGRGVRNCRLESLVLGGIRHTSKEAVGRFLAALNSVEAMPSAPTKAAEATHKRVNRKLNGARR